MLRFKCHAFSRLCQCLTLTIMEVFWTSSMNWSYCINDSKGSLTQAVNYTRIPECCTLLDMHVQKPLFISVMKRVVFHMHRNWIATVKYRIRKMDKSASLTHQSPNQNQIVHIWLHQLLGKWMQTAMTMLADIRILGDIQVSCPMSVSPFLTNPNWGNIVTAMDQQFF